MDHNEVLATLADHGARINNLEGWQKAQNGHLIRIEANVDKLQYWIMGQLAAMLLLALGVWLKG